MKTYDFDEIIPRRHTDCVKHDALELFFGREDLTPMWVADMDFRTPDFIMDALRTRCSHEVLGYAFPPESYWQSVRQWLSRHYNISCAKEELHFIPGIVAGISFVLQAMTQPGDGILVTTPVYPPFLNLPQGGGRRLECSPLKIEDGRFAIDFEDLEWRARQCRWLILSNPHNPGGTVWGEDTLRRVAEICYRNNVNVVSDEIHADMTLSPRHHVSFSTVSPQAKEISITFMAPSKTFNMAGLGSSVCYCGSQHLRERFFGYLDAYEVAGGNIFAYTGAEAAFTHGEEWLVQLLHYLEGNVALLGSYLREHMPLVKAVLPEASYLAWLDFSALGYCHGEIKERLLNRAHVALNDGVTFGGYDYRCCFRLNVGCPRATLSDVLDRIARSME